MPALNRALLNFNPPAPCGAGHAGAFQSISDILFQSTRPVRGGTSYCVARYKQDAISIHPPRAGRDGEGRCAQSELKDFNPPAPCGAGPLRCCRCGYQRWVSIHPPRAGRDSETRLCQIQQKEFQSTRPVRGGTHITAPPQNLNKHFNPPAPCGAGRKGSLQSWCLRYFNPPAPCGAGRAAATWIRSWPRYFNPPAPCGAGLTASVTSSILQDFNPPAPCGAGRSSANSSSQIKRFQSTRPVRGGTGLPQSQSPRRKNFNPPAPCGAGQQSCTKFTPCILAQCTIQRAAKLLFAYQQAYFC